MYYWWILAALLLSFAAVLLQNRRQTLESLSARYLRRRLEGFQDASALVLTPLTRERRGKVLLQGEEWPALAADGETIPADSIVRVVGWRGTHLLVSTILTK